MITPRWYQDAAIDAIFHYFAHNTGNPVVALPTASGKSIVIAGFIYKALSLYPQCRMMMLTHVKELIEQNADKVKRVWPDVPLGIHSAGLRQRDFLQPIIFGGVASVAPNVTSFGHIDLLLVDECHLVNENANSLYQTIIAKLKKANPYLKVVGFTATKYRMGLGRLTDNGIFTHICYDMTDMEGINRLIYEGFLSPLIPKQMTTQIDMKGVGISNGDYKLGEMQAAVDVDEITYGAVREIVQLGADRRAWLIFCSGVEHADHVAAALQSFGIEAASVHSKLEPGERDRRIADFRNGKLRALTNNNVLTTGFDVPMIDLLGILRPTISTPLWVQMLGRGMRISPETYKANCLVLDFAGNTLRLGPINDPVLPKRKGDRGGDAPVKICPECGTFNHISARTCIDCGQEFRFEQKITTAADFLDLIKVEGKVIETFNVDQVWYVLYEKIGSPPMIKVTYRCGIHSFNEFVMPEHPNSYTLERYRRWWMQRHYANPPATTAEALKLIRDEGRRPTRISVWTNRQYPEVQGCEF